MKTPLLPLTMQGERLPVRLDPPRFAADADELLAGIGYTKADITGLRERRAVA